MSTIVNLMLIFLFIVLPLIFTVWAVYKFWQSVHLNWFELASLAAFFASLVFFLPVMGELFVFVLVKDLEEEPFIIWSRD